MKYFKLRISVTSLEQFYRFTTGRIEETELVQQIKRPFETNDFFEVGKAWHSIIEESETIPTLKSPYVSFPIYENEIECVFKLKHIQEIPNLFPASMLHEFKVVKNLKMSNLDIELVGKCDGIAYGNYCFEHKTTTKKNDKDSYFTTYFNSVQWKYYCYLFNVHNVIYTIFHYSKEVIPKLASKKEQWIVSIIDVHKFHFTKYEDNTEFCLDLLDSFVKFIQFHKLEQFFQPYKKQEVGVL